MTRTCWSGDQHLRTAISRKRAAGSKVNRRRPRAEIISRTRSRSKRACLKAPAGLFSPTAGTSLPPCPSTVAITLSSNRYPCREAEW